MRINFHPYLRALLKENLPYILSTLVLFIFTLTTFFIYLPKLLDLNNKKQELSQEVKILKNRLSFIDAHLKDEPLDFYLKILYRLIPLQEDYFSIIYALENLSKKTGFIITGYTINLTDSTPEKLKITVTGTGDKQSFMNFLRDYSFAGGRLITADEISLTEIEMSKIDINLNFYNAPKVENVNKEFNLQIVKNQLDKIHYIVDKVKTNVSTEEMTVSENWEYPKKTNPF
ncbi:MAG: hypothetical protein ACPL1D_01395 [Microgenomates group bacterium]